MKIRQFLISLFIILYSFEGYCGTTFSGLSKSMQIIILGKIEEQVREAKEMSGGPLSPEEIAKIKAKADEVLKGGAMVLVSSQIIN